YITLDNPCLIGISFLPAFLLPSLPLFLPSLPLFLRSLPPSLPNAIEIYSLHIDCKVTSRYAHTVITSRIVNRANESKEALFDVELPKKAFITNFSMTIDGKEYPGIIKEKKAAQAQYDSAISRGQSAGIVKSAGRKLEKFSVSINVAAGGKVNFELNYEQLLDRKLGKYELIIKVKPKQLVEDFQIDAHIFEPQGISFLETESSFLNNEIGNALKKTQEETKAHISFKPTLSQQRKNPDSEETLLDGDFLIRYDVKRNVAIMNGYFVHYFAPSEMPVFPKNIIFVIDKSGSMSGNKIRQTKEALEKILEDLNPKDHFNLIVFSGSSSKWNPTLLQASKENVESAKQYVKTIHAQGGTNINEAVLTAINSLDQATYEELLPEKSISMIILLTDGEPTIGVTDPKKIQKNINEANQGKYFLYCLGFGFDVSYSFLEKLALDNSGVARRIYEDSDATLQLQDFYSEVAIPILKNININYVGNAVEDVTENNFKLLYEGSEIVVAGKFDNEIDIFSLEVKHGSNLTLKENADVTEKAQVFEHQEYIFGNFIEKLWAYLTIQQLLEKAVLAEGAEKKNLENQTLNLSLKYSFVTPMTSMVVTKPEAEEVANKPTEKGKNPPIFYNRSLAIPCPFLSAVDGNPHFIIDIPEQDDHLCFNIYADPGEILKLIRDPSTGITVNGQLIGNKQSKNDVQPQNSYIGRLGILNEELNLKLEVTPEKIILHNGTKQMTFTWLDEVTLLHPTLTLKIIRKKSLEVSMGEGATFVIILHQTWRRNPKHGDFLGFYALDSHRLSEHTHGLLGQFFHPINFTILEVHPGSTPEKPDATMIVKNHQLTVTRGWQKDYTENSKHGTNVPCWFIHNNAEGLIDSTYTDYVVSSLF
uniref:Inter-alpha-trypsin inhibitor heavy chain H4 n=1 Tax=Naja naja TaxID=35670 RepID=A0A8C6V7F5_NAJNA